MPTRIPWSGPTLCERGCTYLSTLQTMTALENITTTWRAAILDHVAGVGVAASAAPLCICVDCLVQHWDDRDDLDRELALAGAAIVEMIGVGMDGLALYAVGRLPDDHHYGDPLRGPDDAPVCSTADATPRTSGPVFPRLWQHLAELVQQLDNEAERTA